MGRLPFARSGAGGAAAQGDRDRARDKLGERLDIRQFHQVVLDQGALPLDVLEKVVDDWIASVAPQRAPS
ncbi:DUF885 family protein [Piscinibacter sp.]|uniref:DUF885 family protein n=1 Tax=Piscinibacter sp. TaxID=1903157 RepID=UPI002C2510BB|nr:DUF885 family protein [Albitalea sp.]HUG23015.1 DUF885 family protein [Albitalea sp.]